MYLWVNPWRAERSDKPLLTQVQKKAKSVYIEKLIILD